MEVRELQKVLIVDDELDICFLFGRILRGRNLKTGYARSLAEAPIVHKGRNSYAGISG